MIALGLAFLPLVGAPEQNVERETAESENPRLIAGITAAMVAGRCSRASGMSTSGRTGTSRSSTSRTCAATLAKAPDKPVPLVDLGIPQTMLWAYRFPENAYSHVFRNLDKETTYPRSSIDRLFVFDDQGLLFPVGIPATRSMQPGSGCGYPLVDDTTSIPLDGPVIGGGWWLRVSYAELRSDRPAPRGR